MERNYVTVTLCIGVCTDPCVYIFYVTIQYNESIYNARMVSRRAESEAQAVARWKDGEARV